MPAMYPEQLRALREQNPGLQYDFRGNLIDGDGYGESLQGWSPYKPDYGMQNPYYGDLLQDVSNLFYKPDNVVDQDWNTYYRQQFGAGDALSRAVQGLDVPNIGFYSQWNPDTNSWVRHGSASDGLGMGTARPSYSPRSRSQAPVFGGQMIPPEVRYQQDGGVDPAYQADLLRQTNQMPFMQSARRAARDVAAFGESFPNLAYQPE